jgi:hypothetical protein
MILRTAELPPSHRYFSQPASPSWASHPIFYLTCRGDRFVKQLKKNTLDIVASFLISGMARKNELRFACFNGVENIFGSLLHDGAISGTRHHNSLPLHLQRRLGKKLRIVNHLARSSGKFFSWGVEL